MSLHLSIPPTMPHPLSFVFFGIQIQIVWLKSKQIGLNPGKMTQIWLENLNYGLSAIILAP